MYSLAAVKEGWSPRAPRVDTAVSFELPWLAVAAGARTAVLDPGDPSPADLNRHSFACNRFLESDASANFTFFTLLPFPPPNVCVQEDSGSKKTCRAGGIAGSTRRRWLLETHVKFVHSSMTRKRHLVTKQAHEGDTFLS